MWCFLFLPYSSLCCAGQLLPTRCFLRFLPLSSMSAMVPYSFKTWAGLLGLQPEPITLRSPFFPRLSQAHDKMQFALEDNIWNKYSPLSVFKESWTYPLKDSSGCSRAFQSVLWNWSTHNNNMVQKHGINWMCWFPYVQNTKGPSVCHIHDDPCTKLLSLQTQAIYSSVTLRLQQLLNFLLGRPVYCFPLLFHLQSCSWEGWVSDGKEVGSDGSDRGMFMLDFHAVPLYPIENSPSPLHSKSCIKHLCVFGGKGWAALIFQLVHHVQLGGSDVLIPFYHPHWLRSPACLWSDRAVLAQLWCRNPYAGLNLFSFC